MAQNGIFRQFKPFIIYIKTKYDQSVLSIVCRRLKLSQCIQAMRVSHEVTANCWIYNSAM